MKEWDNDKHEEMLEKRRKKKLDGFKRSIDELIIGEQLTPCPFCGAEVAIVFQTFGVAGGLRCKKCETTFLIPWNESETPRDLAEAWNRRVNNG